MPHRLLPVLSGMVGTGCFRARNTHSCISVCERGSLRLRKRLFGTMKEPLSQPQRASFVMRCVPVGCMVVFLRFCACAFCVISLCLNAGVSRVFVSPEGCPLSCFHDYGVTSTVMYLHGSGSFFDSYFWECKSDMLSLHKISCTREIESKLSFRSLALSLHKISCTRQSKSKLSLHSLALSLHKISCAREAGIKKLSVCSRHL